MYKMYLISAEGYKNTKVDFLTITATTKNPTKKQVKEYKMTKREIYKQFTNLSKKELNTKNNKKPYVRNDVMTTIIKRCRSEKTRGITAIDGFRNKLMIPDFEIPKCPEFEVKSKVGKIFKKQSP